MTNKEMNPFTEDTKRELVLQGDPKNTALPKLARRLSVSTKALEDTLKKQAFSACVTKDQFISAVIIANTYKLNPILKEIYAFPDRRGQVLPVVSIDGWISLVNRQPDFDGVELLDNLDKNGELVSITCKIYHKNKRMPTTITEYMAECRRNTDPWVKWPRRMLRHKAYIQCARVAFGFSGIYDKDETDRILEEQSEDIKMPEPISGSIENQVEEAETYQAEESEIKEYIQRENNLRKRREESEIKEYIQKEKSKREQVEKEKRSNPAVKKKELTSEEEAQEAVEKIRERLSMLQDEKVWKEFLGFFMSGEKGIDGEKILKTSQLSIEQCKRMIEHLDKITRQKRGE